MNYLNAIFFSMCYRLHNFQTTKKKKQINKEMLWCVTELPEILERKLDIFSVVVNEFAENMMSSSLIAMQITVCLSFVMALPLLLANKPVHLKNGIDFVLRHCHQSVDPK